jgi:hypothetical protein
MTDELTDAQSHQVDVMHNAAYNAVQEILAPLDIEPTWDMEWIGEVCDNLADTVERHLHVPQAFVYPFVGAQDEDVDGNYEDTTPYFWDCGCGGTKENPYSYIHPKTQTVCKVCGADYEQAPHDYPDSIVGEVIKMLALGK